MSTDIAKNEHPLRQWTRTVVGEERIDGRRLHELQGRVAESFPPSDGVEAIETAIALTVGTTEGVVNALDRFRQDQVRKAGVGRPSRRIANYGTKAAENAPKEVGELLALAGLLKPPDPRATEKIIDQVVTMARANKARIELGSRRAIEFPDLSELADMSKALLGINGGADRVVEVRVIDHENEDHDFEVHAFDGAGYHVLDLSGGMAEPGVLLVETLQASHGRNCESLLMTSGGVSVPGRGNAALVAAGLESLIVDGAKAGLHEIRTVPGSPYSQRLYEKMGFTSPGDRRPWRRKLLTWTAQKLPVVSGVLAASDIALRSLSKSDADQTTMCLDLTNRDAVRQALVGFQLARAAITDVPKDVAQKLKVLGEEPPAPSIAVYRNEFPDWLNVRVLVARG